MKAAPIGDLTRAQYAALVKVAKAVAHAQGKHYKGDHYLELSQDVGKAAQKVVASLARTGGSA